jgi:hypothetical protein
MQYPGLALDGKLGTYPIIITLAFFPIVQHPEALIPIARDFVSPQVLSDLYQDPKTSSSDSTSGKYYCSTYSLEVRWYTVHSQFTVEM